MPVNGPFKDKLMGALHTAVQHFNESPSDPNGAVVKAAEQHDFNAEQATRLVETFNTARTIYHYKSASDRTAPFALADSGVVIPSLFKEEEKAASAPATDFDYSDYDRPEAHYEDGMVIGKTAGLRDIDLGGVTEYADTSLEAQAERACKVIHVQRDLAETARGEARVAGTKAAQILGKIAGEMGRGYEEDAKDIFSRLTAAYADDVEFAPVTAKLAEFVPEHLHADASTDDVVDDRDLRGYVAGMKEARDWMQAEAEMLAVADTLDKEANDFEREWFEAIAPALPQQEVQTVADFINPDLRKAAQIAPVESWKGGKGDSKSKDNKDESGSVFDAMGDYAKKTPVGKAVTGGMEEGYQEAIGVPTATTVERGVESMLGAPAESENEALSDRLKNVQRKLLLEDLMVNDSVLSEENPETVANAYSAVLKIAPEVASNKEVVRAILRQVVHSVAIGSYDAQSWTDLEKNLRNIAGKTQPVGGPR